MKLSTVSELLHVRGD